MLQRSVQSLKLKHLVCHCISASSVGQGIVSKCDGGVIVAVLSGLADDGAYDKLLNVCGLRYGSVLVGA